MPEMLLVFMLTTYIDKEPQPNPSYWENINRCNYFAGKIRRQNANYRWRQYNHPPISATCTPQLVPRNARVWK